MTRRTQAERSDATSAKLLAAAQRLFGQDGYTATSIATVAEAAGVTKGAAYHHFVNKAALFEVVFVGEQERVSTLLQEAAAREPDSWSALLSGCRAFLDHCLDPGFQQIVLLDGPAVLGWEQVREIQREHVLRVLTGAMQAAVADGRALPGDLTARCRLIHGALCEAGMQLARSANPDADLPAVTAEAIHLLGSIARTPEPPLPS